MKRLALLAILIPTTSFAFQTPVAAVVNLGVAVFGGTGCPGTGTLTVLDQAKMIYELSFDGFAIEAGGSTGKAFDRKVCSVAIPATISSGSSIAVSKIQYTGFNNLVAGATVKVSTEAFFAGTRSPMIQKSFSNSGDFIIDIILSEAEKSWSGCGASTNLRLSISNELKSAVDQPVSMSKIDGKLVFQLEARQC